MKKNTTSMAGVMAVLSLGAISTIFFIWLIDKFGWLPKQSSTIAPSIDWMINYVHYWSYAFFVLVMGAGTYFLIAYRRKNADDVGAFFHEHPALEGVLVIGPTILVSFLFWWGFQGYMEASVAPPNAYEVHVTGKQWSWEFYHPEKDQSEFGELHVPVDRPVKLIMHSDDVLHSFYVPDFRVKFDVLPNRYSTLWFEATEVTDENVTNSDGKAGHQVFCTEFCGDDHSEMEAMIIVLSQADFDDWGGTDLAEMSLADVGQFVYDGRACGACHSLDGSAKVGPSWQGAWGTTRELADGSSVTVDENYIRESILNPASQVAKGFPPAMPPFQMEEREILGIIQMIKNLGN